MVFLVLNHAKCCYFFASFFIFFIYFLFFLIKKNFVYFDFIARVLSGKDKDREWLLTEKDGFDNEHDKNADGVLDKHEILGWVIPSNE